MSVNPVSPVTFNGGQMTDLPEFTGTLDGSELMEIVAAPAGQSVETDGVNYSITTQLLAQQIINIAQVVVIITNGQYTSPGSPYVVQPTDALIYVNKTVASPTYIQMPSATSMACQPLVADLAGTAAAGNGISVTFTGGELANGLATIPIESAYAGYFFRPVKTLAKWLLGSS